MKVILYSNKKRFVSCTKSSTLRTIALSAFYQTLLTSNVKLKEMLKLKRPNDALEIRTFTSKDKKRKYLILKTPKGTYHAFVEVDAKIAAKDCGSPRKPRTRQFWDALWK